MRDRTIKTSGLSLVEAIVVAALITLVFGGLFSGTRYTLELLAQSRAKLSALSLANDRMELFRSFPYDDVGTIAGIPAGTIPQISTTTLNNIEFTERVLVEYVDDPADGQLTATTTDSNGIPSDYKRIKIEISWEVYDSPGQISLVSNIVPRSIETTLGGGTVRINVVDQDSQPLENAEVRLVNDTTTSTIDITRFSDASGIALFSGAPAASNYEVTVSASGHSTDQTYVATTSNPNPNTAPFTVLESDISTVTFQIDELSDIDTRFLSATTFLSSDELFTDALGIATSTDVVVSGGRLEIQNTAGTYAPTGEVYLVPITPSPLEAWEAVTIAGDTPANTEYIIRFYTASGTDYTLISDSDLAGNSTGFSTAIVDISELDTGAFPSIIPGITLLTSDTSATPQVDEVRVFYRSAETAASSIAVDITGNKTIGTELDTSPIYKFSSVETTDSDGMISLSDMEFDTYAVTPPASFDIAYSCPSLPIIHRGGVDSEVEVGLVANTANSLQVRVFDDASNAIPGANVLLESATSTYSTTIETNPCGTAFFPGLTAANDFVITVTKPGFNDNIVDPYVVGGDSTSIVIMNPV